MPRQECMNFPLKASNLSLNAKRNEIGYTALSIQNTTVQVLDNYSVIEPQLRTVKYVPQQQKPERQMRKSTNRDYIEEYHQWL